MRFLYLNAGLYLNDLYNLVKRKSKAETFSLMAIPGVFAVLFVSVLSIFAHVPNLQSTASQAKRLSLIITTTQPQTNLALLLIVETNYPAFTVPRGFKCRNNREINDTHTNLTTSIYCSKPSSITSPVESKRTELRALR